MKPDSPLVARIVSVARDLGSLANDVVFIGGAIAPLLHTDTRIPRVRPTKDVDGVVLSDNYGSGERLRAALRARGFTHDTSNTAHVHRWVTPRGVSFDLVLSGVHAGGSGNPWDAEAIASAIVATVSDVTFRHAAAPAFIAMKLQAFSDRGNGDLRASHDIEDVLALIANRSSIVTDFFAADLRVRSIVRRFAVSLLDGDTAEEVLSAHLNNADDVAATVRLASVRLTKIAQLP